jgi:hypothetical protein
MANGVAQWSVEDVARWLSSQRIDGADAVAQRFREEDVDGEALLPLAPLTRKDIQEDFDLSLGKATKLLAAICQLAAGGRAVYRWRQRGRAAGAPRAQTPLNLG